MATRAKFYCSSVKKSLHWSKPGAYLYESEFSAVTSGGPENESFFEATPAGSIKLSTVKEDLFTPGKEYYIDFTEATKEEK